MEKYKSLYKWMVIPMVIMQWGIFSFYWGDFTDNAWSVHIHYWTATVWYVNCPDECHIIFVYIFNKNNYSFRK